MGTMDEKELHEKRNRLYTIQASMDMRIVGLNFALSIVLIALLFKRITGY